MRVHGRGGGQADRLADVAHGRRVAVLRRVLLDEVEDLLLALGEVEIGHSAPLSGGFSCGSCEHVFVEYRAVGRNGGTALRRYSPAPLRACGGIGRRARLRALSCLCGVGVRVTPGAWRSACKGGERTWWSAPERMLGGLGGNPLATNAVRRAPLRAQVTAGLICADQCSSASAADASRPRSRSRTEAAQVTGRRRLGTYRAGNLRVAPRRLRPRAPTRGRAA